MSPSTILALNEWPKILKISSKWRKFAKSGHTSQALDKDSMSNKFQLSATG